ncbi:MAG TPA: sigma-70 family RNA polymerase sigma factor [Planctomycetota bacterium]|nr:sigma-70 family RNA polymerase sigma factor [Planctomycetota bacterium]
MSNQSNARSTSEELLARYALSAACFANETDVDAKALHRLEAEEAFTALYYRHRVGLLNFVYVRMGGLEPYLRQGGEAVSADTWIEIAKWAYTFKARSAFFTWACQIALRRISKRVAKARTARSLQAEFDAKGRQPALDNIRDRAAPVPTQVAERERSEEFEAALATLGDAQRMLLELRAKRGLSWPEIEEIMGVPRSTLQSRLVRAAQPLRSFFRKHFPHMTTGAQS